MDSRFKVQAFFEEFPFLMALARPSYVSAVSVARVGVDFLVRDLQEREAVHFLNESGEVLVSVDPEEYAETIGEALLRAEPAIENIRFAVLIEGKEDHQWDRLTITIYKPPKGFTLKGWVEEQKRRASAQIQAMVAKIDAEGETREEE